MAQTYAAIGDNARAKKLVDTLWKKSDQYVTFFLSLDKDKFKGEEYNCQLHMFYIMQKLINNLKSQLDNINIQEADGSITNLGKKYGDRLVVDDVCRKLDTCARVLRFAVVHVGKLIQLANVADFVAVVDNARVVPPLGVISQVACCIVWNEFHWTS